MLSGSVSTPQSRISRNKSDLFLSALKAGLGSCLPLSTMRPRQLDTYWTSGTLTQTPVLPGQELSVATALENSVIIPAHLGFPPYSLFLRSSSNRSFAILLGESFLSDFALCLGAVAYNLIICLIIKCPPPPARSTRLNAWLPEGGTILQGSRNFQRLRLYGGSESLRAFSGRPTLPDLPSSLSSVPGSDLSSATYSHGHDVLLKWRNQVTVNWAFWNPEQNKSFPLSNGSLCYFGHWYVCENN